MTRRALTFLLALIAVWMAVPSLAFAQTVSAPPAPDLSKIVLLLCAAAPLGFRALSSRLGWVWPHSTWGAAILTCTSAIGASLYGLVQAHGFSLHVVELAVYGGIAGLCGVANGSNIANVPATLAARRKIVAALLLPVVFFMAACGCFTATSVKYNTKTCVEVRKVVDCTANVALDIVSMAGPAIASGLLAGSGFDVGALASAAENVAPGGGICLLGAVEAAIPAPGTTAALPALLVSTRSRVHAHARALAAKVFNLPVPIDVKLHKADGTVATVTLEPGVS